MIIMPSLGWLPNEAKEGFVMMTVATHRTGRKQGFDAVAGPFLQGEGLPFAEVLDAESIHRCHAGQSPILLTVLGVGLWR